MTTPVFMRRSLFYAGAQYAEGQPYSIEDLLAEDWITRGWAAPVYREAAELTLPIAGVPVGTDAASLFAPSGVPIYPATADATGLTAAIAAVAAADFSAYVRVEAPITLASNVTLLPGVTIAGFGAPVISGTGWLVHADRAVIQGLRFLTDYAVRLPVTGSVNAVVQACDFFGCDHALKDDGTSAPGVLHEGTVFRRNKVRKCSYAVYGFRMVRAQIVENDLQESTNRNIQFSGGRANRVAANLIRGGITGVSLLLDRSFTGLYEVSSIRECLIEGNDIEGITEESIGLDVQGNTAADIAVADQFTVNSTSGSITNNPSIVVNRAALFTISRAWIVFATGALAGRTFETTFNAVVVASTTIRLQFTTTGAGAITAAEFASITPGDLVTLSCVVRNCKVRGNRIVSEVGTGIFLWGNCFQNDVEFNDVTHLGDGVAIGVRNLAGLLASDLANNNTTTSALVAPSSENLVRKNTVRRGYIHIAGKSYDPIGSTVGGAAQYKNRVEDNEAALVSEAWYDSTGTLQGTAVNDPALEVRNAAAVSPSKQGAAAANIATIGVQASPFVYQNISAGKMDVIVRGGTVSLIEISRDNTNWHNVGFAAGIVALSASDRVRVTYTVAPTMTVIPR